MGLGEVWGIDKVMRVEPWSENDAGQGESPRVGTEVLHRGGGSALDWAQERIQMHTRVRDEEMLIREGITLHRQSLVSSQWPRMKKLRRTEREKRLREKDNEKKTDRSQVFGESSFYVILSFCGLQCKDFVYLFSFGGMGM